MKIIFIARKYDYGDPKRGFSFEYYNFYDTLVKMNGGKNIVTYFPIDQMMSDFGDVQTNKKLLDMVFEEKPDLCFFCLSKDEIQQETIKRITKESEAITFNWFADDHWRFYNFSRHFAPCFDWIATTDPAAIGRYHKIGYQNVITTQWACNHFLYKPSGEKKAYDVTFLGQPHGNRRKIIRQLLNVGVPVECFGLGWKNGRITQEKMITIFSQSKISIGLTNSSSFGFFKSFGSIFLKKNTQGEIRLVSPINWFDNMMFVLAKRYNQSKARSYEVPGCGSFLLTQDADDLRDRYQDGKEIVIFKDTKDLIKKIKYYLEHDDEREMIALAGYRRTMEDHTYEKRFNEIFKIINLA